MPPEAASQAATRAPEDASAGRGGSGQAQTAQAPAPKPDKPFSPSGGPNTQSQLDKAIQEQKDAELAKAGIAGKLADDSMRIQQAAESRRVELSKYYDEQWKQNEARSKQLADSIAAAQIDPNRLWSRAGTGGQIMAGIGMILGGIGSGMTMGRQQNMAADVINKAIDRDMDAQKLELGKKENLLSHYMQQGHSLQQARSMATADLMDAARGQLQMVTTKYAGSDAAANAQMAIGKLDEDASTKRGAAYTQSLHNKLANVQLQEAAVNMAAQKQTMELMSRIQKGDGFPREALDLPAFKDYRERSVDLPDGTVGFARSPKQAEEFNDHMAEVSALKGKLGRYNQLLKSYSSMPLTDARNTAQSLHADIMQSLESLHKAGRLNDKVFDLLKDQVPDLSAIGPQGARAKLKELGAKIDDTTQGLIDAHITTKRGAPKPSALVIDNG